MKTRQQRLAEERAGHPPSPPQSLPVNQRGPRRARSQTPSATVAAGSVVPAAQSAILEEPQALIRVWVDAGPEHDPTHQMMFRSKHFPAVVAFLNNIHSESNEITSPHQEIPEQEMEASIKPKKPEAVTADKPAKRRKSVFRRNPEMRFPAELLASTSAADDCVMKDVSETGNTVGRSVDSSIQAAVSEANLDLQTPRGSKWSLGSLYQSACSVTRRLVFNPLGSIPESPESSLQTATTSAPQAMTESTAPTAPAQPKKKSSAPSSSRDKRAKSRRHDNLAVNTGTNQGHRRRQAKTAKPVSDNTEAMELEEAHQAGAEEPMARQNILWPSRSLDRMNANKRKRGGDPIDTPGEAGSHGQATTDRSEDGGNTEEQPGKRRRTGEPGGSTGQVAGNHKGGKTPKTPIPVTNREGTFKVPSPSDSDWSESGSDEEEETNHAGLEGIPLSRALRPAEAAALRKARAIFQKHKPHKAYPGPPVAGKRQSEPSPSLPGDDAEKRQPGHQAATEPSTSANLEPSGHIKKFTAFEDWCQTASPAVIAAIEKMEVDSDMAGNAVEKALENPGPDHAAQHTAYEEWCRTAPPAVVAVLEQMEVDSNIAGQAFESGLDKFTQQE